MGKNPPGLSKKTWALIGSAAMGGWGELVMDIITSPDPEPAMSNSLLFFLKKKELRDEKFNGC